MDEFIRYLERKRISSAKRRPYYVQWVRNLYNFLNKRPGEPLNNDEIKGYFSSISETYKDWQVQQAKESVQLYLHFQRQPKTASMAKPTGIERLWSGAVDQMVSAMRLKHMALKTEQTYIGWMRQFYRRARAFQPNELTSDHVIDFLTHLAVDRKVSRATQNQAFNALLFFFRHVLKQDIGELWKSVRSKRKRRLPVVLSTEEVQQLLDNVHGLHRLMLQVIYGGGLRLSECLRPRIKDLDFDRECMVVRASKGDKDRETLLPEKLPNMPMFILCDTVLLPI